MTHDSGTLAIGFNCDLNIDFIWQRNQFSIPCEGSWSKRLSR
jgi:hypothetical protein